MTLCGINPSMDFTFSAHNGLANGIAWHSPGGNNIQTEHVIPQASAFGVHPVAVFAATVAAYCLYLKQQSDMKRSELSWICVLQRYTEVFRMVEALHPRQ